MDVLKETRLIREKYVEPEFQDASKNDTIFCLLGDAFVLAIWVILYLG